MNLFDHVPIFIETEEVEGRPYDFEFLSDGTPVRIRKIVTSCPFCGQGNDIDVEDLTDGLYDGRSFEWQCNICKRGKVGLYIDDLDDEYIDIDVHQNFIEEDNKENENEELEKMVQKRPDESITSKRDSVTIDDDTGTLKATCAFVDPIELGRFVIDEL